MSGAPSRVRSVAMWNHDHDRRVDNGEMKNRNNLRAVCLVRAIVDDLLRVDVRDGGCCWS